MHNKCLAGTHHGQFRVSKWYVQGFSHGLVSLPRHHCTQALGKRAEGLVDVCRLSELLIIDGIALPPYQSHGYGCRGESALWLLTGDNLRHIP